MIKWLLQKLGIDNNHPAPLPAQPQPVVTPIQPITQVEYKPYFQADNRVSRKDEDEFDRYPFAEKLAGMIASHRSPNGLVIGIYGQWGEGKSSFLDFVHDALEVIQQSQSGNNLAVIKFNPWRFSGEDQLLMSFFAELRVAVCENQGVDENETELRNKITKYEQVILARQSAADALTTKSIANYIDDESLERIKDDINNSIVKLNKRLLIFIDDSDRLNNQEVESTMRLVKLTADFHNTIYLMALNHEMVARAIGSQYGDGGKEAGTKFLEKIIQVPLHLPRIQPSKIRSFLQNRIDEVLFNAGIKTTEQDRVRYTRGLESSILSQITNPRGIQRFANVLSVVIPLLQDEANTADIILLEALRLYYPDIYEKVRESQDKITGGIDDKMEPGNTPRLRGQLEQIFGENGKYAGQSLAILAELFPIVDHVYYTSTLNFFPRERRSEIDLNNTRSIGSPFYFKRYFSYAVQEGEISEKDFAEFLSLIKIGNLVQSGIMVANFISRSSTSELFRRLESQLPKNQSTVHLEEIRGESDVAITAQEAENYCKLLVDISDYLDSENISGRAVRLITRSSGLIISYLKIIPIENIPSIFKYIIRQSNKPILAIELLSDIVRIMSWSDQSDFGHLKDFFSLEENYQAIASYLIKRVRKESISNNVPWYSLYPTSTPFLLSIWKVAYGRESVTESLKKYFDTDLEQVATFLMHVSPTANTGKHIVFIRLDEPTYNMLSESLDVNYLFEKSIELTKGEKEVEYNGDVFAIPTPHERVHQFIYFHNKVKERAAKATMILSTMDEQIGNTLDSLEKEGFGKETSKSEID